ncbi:MAG TPA: penicillin-binding transpeptidase domain-containing protein [Planctomycetota bacterium]|nr:penicillin-binding transpeptidase domain-containing protein [Planctomycetota bacterium]
MTRIRIAQWLRVLLAMGAVLAIRLFDLQVLSADRWEAESRELLERRYVLPFRRGAILDRLGTPIAYDVDSYAIDLDGTAFRRGHPLALAARIRETLERRFVPLGEVAALPPATAAIVGALTPARLAQERPATAREELRLDVSRLLGLSPADVRRLRDAVRARDVRPVGAIFPEAAARVAVTIATAVADLAAIDAGIGERAGWCLSELDVRRARAQLQIEDGVTKDVKDGRIAPEDVAAERARRRRRREGWLERLRVGAPYAVAERIARYPRRYAGLVPLEMYARKYAIDRLPGIVGFVSRPTDDDLRRTQELRDRLDDLLRSLERGDDEEREIESIRRRLREESYLPGEVRGASGIEARFEDELRGTRGWKVVARDPAGEADIEESREPIGGHDVMLTIDASLQMAVEQVLKTGVPGWRSPQLRGAIVVMDLRTGDILAMATAPDFERAAWETPEGRKELLALDGSQSLEHPLHHRAYRPYVPPAPGSVFKVVTALAGLEKGVITPESTWNCTGPLGRVKCEGHGTVDLRKALEVSCNAYFGWVGEKVGLAPLAAEAHRFGFGERTGLGFREVVGEIPMSRRDADSVRRFGIGENQLRVTPVQVARAYAAVANGGWLPKARIVRAVGGKELPLEPPVDLRLSPYDLQAVRDGLARVVSGPGGTARTAFAGSTPDLAGKTGTPEADPKRDINHAWFAGYAPRDAPRVAFAVYVERVHGEHGGDIAAPIVKALLARDEMRPYLARP